MGLILTALAGTSGRYISWYKIRYAIGFFLYFIGLIYPLEDHLLYYILSAFQLVPICPATLYSWGGKG